MKKKQFLLIYVCFLTFILCSCTSQKATQNSSSKENQTEIDADQLIETETGKESVENIVVDADTPAGNGNYYIAVSGIQQYDSFDGEKISDTPKDGNVFLVLYLTLGNYGKEPYYFSPEYVSASVDGTEIDNAFLMNDPNGYKTAFETIDPTVEYNGYIVWEVPKEWENFEIKYSGWEESDYDIININFSPADLFNPAPVEE